MIPRNINEQHVIKAIKFIERHGIPTNRLARNYNLLYAGKTYPAKYVLGRANFYANGKELNPGSYSGGKETNSFLSSLNFKIRELSAPILFTRYARAIMELDLQPSDLRNSSNPWDAHKKDIIKQFIKRPKLYIERLFKIGDLCRKRNVNIVVFPACTFIHSKNSEIQKYLYALEGIDWIITGRLNHRTINEDAAIYNNGSVLTSFNSQHPIACGINGDTSIAAISSTIGKARKYQDVVGLHNPKAVCSIFDLGHHQYSGRYMLTLQSVHKQYEVKPGTLITILAFWKTKCSSTSSPWALGLGRRRKMKRNIIETGGYDDFLDSI